MADDKTKKPKPKVEGQGKPKKKKRANPDERDAAEKPKSKAKPKVEPDGGERKPKPKVEGKAKKSKAKPKVEPKAKPKVEPEVEPEDAPPHGIELLIMRIIPEWLPKRLRAQSVKVDESVGEAPKTLVHHPVKDTDPLPVWCLDQDDEDGAAAPAAVASPTVGAPKEPPERMTRIKNKVGQAKLTREEKAARKRAKERGAEGTYDLSGGLVRMRDREEVADCKATLYKSAAPIGDPAKLASYPGVNEIWCYGDANGIEVLGRFAADSAYKYQSMREDHPDRQSKRRAALKPFVYPVGDRKTPFDRTHMIPFAFHGSEQSPWLLVGWDSDQNQGVLADFEEDMRTYNTRKKMPLLWYTSVKRTPTGAKWRYRIYDATPLSKRGKSATLHQIGKLDVEDNESFKFKDPSNVVW